MNGLHLSDAPSFDRASITDHHISRGFQPIADELRGLSELQLFGKVVLMRVDANVPYEDGRILQTNRLTGFADTVWEAHERGAHAILLVSHFKKGDPAKDSLRPIAEQLPKLLAMDGKEPEVWFCDDYATPDARRALHARLAAADRHGAEVPLVVMLENTRFHPGEKAGDVQFAAALAALGDVYVNDAFGAAHRAEDASVGPLAELFAERGLAAAGLLMKRELERVERLMLRAQEPFVVVQAGSKIETKAPLLEALVRQPIQDLTVLLAGETGFALAGVRGSPLGSKELAPEKRAVAEKLDATLRERGCKVVLPVDAVVVENGVDMKRVTGGILTTRLGEGVHPVDIGPRTIALFEETIRAKLGGGKGTLIANGTPGIYEHPAFRDGSIALNRAIAALPATVDRLIGGGDSGGFAIECGVPAEIISTGGGALLEAIERGTAAMPALQPLRRR